MELDHVSFLLKSLNKQQIHYKSLAFSDLTPLTIVR
jgi:hypothetical protein